MTRFAPSRLDLLPSPGEVSIAAIADRTTVPELLARIVRDIEGPVRPQGIATGMATGLAAAMLPQQTGPAESFQFMYRRTNSLNWFTLDAETNDPSAELQNLDVNTCYDCQVFALNAAGAGPGSDVFVARTLDGDKFELCKVECLAVTARTACSITVGWQVATFGCEPPNYNIECRLYGHPMGKLLGDQILAPDRDSCTIFGLEPCKRYEIRVQVAGIGRPAPWSCVSATTAEARDGGTPQVKTLCAVWSCDDSVEIQVEFSCADGTPAEDCTFEGFIFPPHRAAGNDAAAVLNSKRLAANRWQLVALNSATTYAVRARPRFAAMENGLRDGEWSDPVLVQTTSGAKEFPAPPASLHLERVTARNAWIRCMVPQQADPNCSTELPPPGGLVEYVRLRYQPTNQNGGWTTLPDIAEQQFRANGNIFHVAGLDAGKSYDFEAIAGSGCGRESCPSPRLRVSTLPDAVDKPGPVADLALYKRSAHQLGLRWSTPPVLNGTMVPKPIRDVTFYGATLDGTTENNGRVVGGSMSNVEIANCKIVTATMEACKLRNADFENASIKRATISDTKIVNSVVEGQVRLAVRTCRDDARIEATESDHIIIVENAQTAEKGSPKVKSVVVLPRHPEKGTVAIVKSGKSNGKEYPVEILAAPDGQCFESIQNASEARTFVFNDQGQWTAI